VKTLTRREFLQRSLAGTGLAIAVTMTPMGSRLLTAEEIEKDESIIFTPNAWLQITPDNMVHVIVNKSEMGQGVDTALPMIVADELDADWGQVRFKVAPAADIYKDPVWGTQGTGGSSSVRHMYETLRKAGASAREMLISAASETWGVPSAECRTSMGTVIHAPSNRTFTYGQLTRKASSLPLPKNPYLKKEGSFSFIGRAVPRLDIPDKVNGKAVFGIDVSVYGMLYATVEHPPAFGAKAVTFDKEAGLKVSGVTDVVLLNNGIAVCAKTPDAAWSGRKALHAKWEGGANPGMDNTTLQEMFVRDSEKKGLVARSDGDVKAALDKAARRLDVSYMLPYLSHATMEPMDCVADVGRERCTIWAPTQNQTGVFKLAEKETGLKPDQIHVHTTYLGGGFGIRFETKVVEEAIQISKAVRKPVKLIWKREDDIRNDFYRPGNYSRVIGGLDEKGDLLAWSHKIVCPSIFERAMPNRIEGGIDPAAVEGLKNMEYEVPNLYVEYVKIDLPVPVGFWRSVGSTHNAFTVESFVDEMAAAAGKDPLAFRLNLLKNHKRAYRVLETVAEKAGWNKPLAGGKGRGIAQHFSFGSYVAHVAEVSVDRKTGTVKVHRVVSAVDCGPVVNPAIITAQIRGAVIMGLSAALKEQVKFAKGGVESSNFDNYALLRMSEAPEIEVHIVKSDDPMGGIGEPGLPPIAPALANAVYNAAKVRIRNLPMTPESVLRSMKV
jgi:isoquinoline 1-oxidoreductase beta subunit